MQIVKTFNGWRVYGNFGAVMDLSNDRIVLYCNMAESSPEYKRMIKFASKK